MGAVNTMENSGLDLNPEFLEAIAVMNSGMNAFITGKAGTGKSTLLRYFLETTSKEFVVVAPTGIAAINVGGTTIHRLFSFPSWVDIGFVHSRDYHPDKDLISQLEVLIIDEVSMVRADLFDTMEAALRRFGPKRGLPFGGVQIILVGDPFQLPPIVLEGEETFFRGRYPTPYFFSADSFRDFNFELIELTRIYRQSDDQFIDVLNAIRVGEANDTVLELLNKKFDPNFEPPVDEFWVTLTTTNAMAERQNLLELQKIDSEPVTSIAEIFGEIDEKDFPTARNLEFKVGAQIMLLNNDPGDQWVNGSMGVIEDVTTNPDLQVSVRISATNKVVNLNPYTWEVLKPIVDGSRIRTQVVGTFRQFPFKLSWAITIHKSQGQTLDKVIVSLGRGTFAEGQLYVALSRCTSLDGLKLKSQVKSHHVKFEREVHRWLRRIAVQDHEDETVREDRVERAFLGAIVTGYTRFDKIMELAVLIERQSGILEQYSSLINPMRDIGSSQDHGISASMLSAAPTIEEAWPFFARRLEGLVIVAQGLPSLQTAIERELGKLGIPIDMGLGIDIQPMIENSFRTDASKFGFELPTQPSALDIAFATMAIFESNDVTNFATVPYLSGIESSLPARIQTRSNEQNYLDFTSSADASLAYRDLVILAASQEMEPDQARAILQDQVQFLNLSDNDVCYLNELLVADLMEAVKRDGLTSEFEQSLIQRLTSVLGLSMPELKVESTQEDLPSLLPEGSAVCFTGSAQDDQGDFLERDYLESLALKLNLKVVKSVTKKCVAVIAADTSSMSGKAKEARMREIAVVHVSDFLKWAQNHQSSTI